MLSTASRGVPRARALQSHHVTIACNCQQRRGIRFGPWGSHEADLHRDARQRHRSFRYQYMESLMRKGPWNYQPVSEETQETVEKAMSRDMKASAASQEKNAYADIDNDGKSCLDDSVGVRPGRNIEDVERELMNHLIQPGRGGKSLHEQWSSPLTKLRKYLHAEGNPKEVTPKEVLHATTSTDAYNDSIDPITNRRTQRNPSSSYSNQEGTNDVPDAYQPVQWNEPDGLHRPSREEESKKYDDLEKYKPVKWNEPDGLERLSAEQDSKNYDDLGEYTRKDLDDPNQRPKLTLEEKSKYYQDLGDYKSMQWSEPHGLPKPSAEELSKNYDDVQSYEASRWNEPNGLPKKTSEEMSRDYNDLHNYNAIRWDEPDGLRHLTPEELSKEYEDLQNYRDVRWNEPDGLQHRTPEELSKDYSDLEEYGAVRWQEPNGLRRPTPEEESKQYDDLGSYDGPRTALDAVIAAHEAIQMDSTPKGEPLASKVEVAQEDPSKEYKDLNSYSGVYWNEPDGMPNLTPEEESKNYNDLDKYGPVRWNEPDGLRQPTPEEESKKYEDVPAYSPKEFSEPEAIPVHRHPEEVSKNYDDLESYIPVSWNEPDGLPNSTPEERSRKYTDLAQYTTDLKDTSARRHPEENTKDYKDLNQYAPESFDRHDLQQPPHPEESSKMYTDLDKYHAMKFDFDNNRFSTHLEGAAKQYKDVGSSYETPETAAELLEQEQPLENLTPEDVRSDVMRRAQKLGPGNNELGDLEPKDISSSRNLTGNYIRDFPEEFSTSWSISNSPSKSSLFPKNKVDEISAATIDLGDGAEASSMDESFPCEAPKLQPALDRHARRRSDGSFGDLAQIHKDPYSKTPQGLQTSYSEECGGVPTWPIIVKHYGNASADSSPPSAKEPKSGTEEPQMYKILAYDSSTDSISTAETSSAVQDTSAPLTPAEIVLKLSSPAKFFPHLTRLTAQGYDMVSGSGDVLVFRKVRPASQDPIPPVNEIRPLRSPPINPVDMMGKPPITGNFASPTGFVNYDTIAEDDIAKPAPPFRSASSTARDEEASTRSNSDGLSTGRKKKRSLGKKVVLGTASVAGAAYAAGVTAEYFSTHKR